MDTIPMSQMKKPSMVSGAFILWTYLVSTVISLPLVSDTKPDKSAENSISMTDSLTYLETFGYLRPDDDKTASLRTEESFRSALKHFQKMAGIPITGQLDNATQEMMALPRCGNKDEEQESVGSGSGTGGSLRRRKRYVLQGSKWARPDITYKISAYPRGIPREKAEKEVYSALKIWEDVTPLKFILRRRAPRVDINVLFTRRAHGDGNPFDGRGRTLAHAFFPQYGGDAHFDNDEEWTIGLTSGINMFQVAAHEFGHSLGLSHSNVRSALMAPFYRGYQPDFELDKDDVMAIQQLYGVPKRDKDDDDTTNQKPIRPTNSEGGDGPVLTVPKLCTDPKIDAMFTGQGQVTYIFKGDEYYRIEPWGIASGYPKSISEDWYPVQGPIDSALYWANGYTYIFKGTMYYKFYGKRFKYSRSISSGFIGIPNNIDASFVWSRNKITYFIKGDKYWRYSSNQADADYPKPLSLWGSGMPRRVDAAVKWRNGKTYFFREDMYYRYNDVDYKIDSTYPRYTAEWWLGCPDKESIKDFNDIQDLYGAPDMPDWHGQSGVNFVAAIQSNQPESSTGAAMSELGQSNASITMETPEESSDKEKWDTGKDIESSTVYSPAARETDVKSGQFEGHVADGAQNGNTAVAVGGSRHILFLSTTAVSLIALFCRYRS